MRLGTYGPTYFSLSKYLSFAKMKICEDDFDFGDESNEESDQDEAAHDKLCAEIQTITKDQKLR